jgi:hypothetical protein
MIATKTLRAAATALVLAAVPVAAYAADPQPSPISRPSSSDRITAGKVLEQLRAMGFQGEVKADEDGSPRIVTMVDGYKWIIYFYGCDKDGALESRGCSSLTLRTGLVVDQVTAESVNKWNSEKRYARAYTVVGDNGKTILLLDLDYYMTEGTDAVKAFNAHFELMRHQARAFRKHVDA